MKNRMVRRDANDYLWFATRCERIIRWEPRQANAVAPILASTETRNAFQGKLRIDNGIISESSILDHTKETWKKAFARCSAVMKFTEMILFWVSGIQEKKEKEYKYGTNVEYTFNRRPQFHNNISTTRRKRRVTNTSGIATDKSTIDKENATY